MGSAEKVRKVLREKGITQIELAKRAGKSEQTLRNLLSRDSMSYATVETLLDAVDCDIVFKDRHSGRIFEDC